MKTYIYPTYNPERDTSGNMYIKYFHDSFDKEVELVNKKAYLGISSLFFNLGASVFIIHWVDLIPLKRYGLIQTFLFLVALSLLLIKRKKIVWVLHNKAPHRKPQNLLDKFKDFLVHMLIYVMSRASNFIITHAREGVSFIKGLHKKINRNKVKYVPHPVYSQKLELSKTIKWDYVVWGGISKYKNIAQLFDIISKSDKLQKRKFLVCGKCTDDNYLNELNQKKPNNVTFINEFVSDAELTDYLKTTKAILFTYKLDTVLSSGALIYSFNFCKTIIGPNGGSFCDYPSIVSCYDSLDEICKIDIEKKPDVEYVRSYIHENCWDLLSIKILKFINV